jgi:hypothetical protein
MADVITANRLADGIVVFFDGRGWVEAFVEGAVFDSAEATAAALALAKRSEADNEVVEPYAVELIERNGHFAPKALREAIRVNGPTIRRDLGKQAEGRGLAAAEGAHVSL